MSVKATAAAMRVVNWEAEKEKERTRDRLLLFKFCCFLEVNKEKQLRVETKQVMDIILRLGRNHQPAFCCIEKGRNLSLPLPLFRLFIYLVALQVLSSWLQFELCGASSSC